VLILGSSLLIVVITLFKGFKVDENPLFILFESVLNFLILVDFLFRVKLVGIRKYFSGAGNSTSRVWNWLDAFVVVTSVLMFIVILFSHSIKERGTGDNYLRQASEIALLVVWALFQTIRVIFIAKRQRLAQQSAKTLIDFTHNIINVETEVPHNESRQTGRPSLAKASDEVIVFDLKSMEQNLRGPLGNSKIVGKEGTHFKNRRRLGASHIMNSESGVHPLPSQEGMTDTIEMHDMSAREQQDNNGKKQPQQQ
jgi:hypothetical protein